MEKSQLLVGKKVFGKKVTLKKKNLKFCLKLLFSNYIMGLTRLDEHWEGRPDKAMAYKNFSTVKELDYLCKGCNNSYMYLLVGIMGFHVPYM